MARVLQRWWPLRFGKLALPFTQLTAAQRKRNTYRTALLLWLGLALGLWAVIAFQFPQGSDQFQVGHPSPYSVVAPYSKVFESKVLTAEKRAQAENDDANVARTRDFSVPQQQRAELNQLLRTISNVRDDPSLSFPARREKLTTLPSASVVLSATLADSILAIDKDAWNNLYNQSLSLYDRAIAQYNYELDEAAVAQLRERSLPYWTADLPPHQRELALFFSSSFLRVNSTVDLEETVRRKQEARDAVKPVQISIQQGESIVRQGDPVRPDTLERLQEIGAIEPSLNWIVIAGRGVLAGLLAATFILYMLFFQTHTAEQPRPLAVIVVLLLITALAARLLLPLWAAWPYAFPLATLVLVLVVLFNGQIALMSAAVLSIVIGFLGESVFSLTVTLFLGSAAAAFVVRRAERSLTFLLAGVIVAAATALTQISFWMQSSTNSNWEELLPILLFSGMSGALSTILSLGLFTLVGRAAGIVTPMQLMELAHPNQPLMRKLIHEAPGTYYHSVSVANLAESAAEAIGADALLLRVGAYYHDIGKTIRPYFFTDNQTDRENVHDDLDPHISAEIIADHVREGRKMAEDARLPDQIVSFIATHHGTSVIRNFYQLALQREDSVDVEDFRYPGPRPLTREQGILMLADSVEATVRSKAQNGKLLTARATEQEKAQARTEGRLTLEELVGSIIDDRIRSGQLDDSPLTLRDFSLIKQAFVISLQGIYHPRADYAPQIVKAP